MILIFPFQNGKTEDYVLIAAVYYAVKTEFGSHSLSILTLFLCRASSTRFCATGLMLRPDLFVGIYDHFLKKVSSSLGKGLTRESVIWSAAHVDTMPRGHADLLIC